MQDLKTKLCNHIIKEFSGFYVTEDINDCVEFTFDFESALYWYAYDFHDGQNSDLYSILSTSKFHPGISHTCIEDEDSETSTMIYNEIKHYIEEAKHDS